MRTRAWTPPPTMHVTYTRAHAHARETDTRANASPSLSLPNPRPFPLLLPDQGVEGRVHRHPNPRSLTHQLRLPTRLRHHRRRENAEHARGR